MDLHGDSPGCYGEHGEYQKIDANRKVVPASHGVPGKVGEIRQWRDKGNAPGKSGHIA
jgi:hypothetical protein